MRVAYLTQVDMFTDSGVRTKHIMQYNIWKKLGHSVKFFSIPFSVNYSTPIQADFDIVQFDILLSKSLKRNSNIISLLRQIANVINIKKSLKRYQPDIVYMRAMTWFPGLDFILRDFKVIIEGNTLVREELKASGSVVGKFLNNIGEKKIGQNIDGVIGVTDEIRKYYQSLNPNIKSITITNGYDFNALNRKKSTKASSVEPPNLIFVGSPGLLWHGVDHYYQMARLLPDFNFHLVGPKLDESYPQLKNFFEYGFLKKEALNDLYLRMDIGVGTLALYRKNMNVACSLKTREYLAAGLPVIIAHRDDDLSGRPFVLEIDNNKESVKRFILEIEEFINDWKDKVVSKELVAPLIDINTKEKLRLEFFKSVYEDQ
ncbi:hypothetical protein [Albibacterium profundi]|uniref:Glycosyltransferase subfamily 4-like N-terminal domain-containing protein n=1 Tax=Albibacterium profundi TaxID=3134906 RepID=A0ABV5CAA1_9SPHI